jgi:hypothetical protein
LNAINFEALGFTKEQILDRIVEKYVEELRFTAVVDEDGDPLIAPTKFDNAVRARLETIINAKVDEIAEKSVLPKVNAMFEGLMLQKTNQWGEKTGKSVSFIEYITERANAWMTEKVDFEGKSKDESRSSFWSPHQTRVAHMLDRHLHYTIDTAMKNAIGGLNKTVADGLAETVKIKLGEVLARLRVETTTK